MFKNISKLFAAGLQPLPNHQVKTMNSTWIYTLVFFNSLEGYISLVVDMYLICVVETSEHLQIYICICISLEIEYFQNILQIFSWRLLAHEPLLEDRSDLLLYDLCCCSWQVLPCYTCQNLVLWFHHGWTHPQQKTREHTHPTKKREHIFPKASGWMWQKNKKNKNHLKQLQELYIYISVQEMSGFSIHFCVQIVGTAFAL